MENHVGLGAFRSNELMNYIQILTLLVEFGTVKGIVQTMDVIGYTINLETAVANRFHNHSQSRTSFYTCVFSINGGRPGGDIDIRLSRVRLRRGQRVAAIRVGGGGSVRVRRMMHTQR